jgi:hypothetical protein
MNDVKGIDSSSTLLEKELEEHNREYSTILYIKGFEL